VVLYSDGAIEVTNAEEEELGAEGLCRLMVECGLGRKDLFSLDALERRLLEFSNQIRLPDDLTLVAVQVKGG
jgi:serine phosphatase RsbU (regulator of sigma subunit)